MTQADVAWVQPVQTHATHTFITIAQLLCHFLCVNVQDSEIGCELMQDHDWLRTLLVTASFTHPPMQVTQHAQSV